MMKLQGLIVTARSPFGDHRPTFGFDIPSFVGVVFFPSSPIWGLCYSLVLPIDGTGLGNVFGGGGMLQREYF